MFKSTDEVKDVCPGHRKWNAIVCVYLNGITYIIDLHNKIRDVNKIKDEASCNLHLQTKVFWKREGFNFLIVPSYEIPLAKLSCYASDSKIGTLSVNKGT